MPRELIFKAWTDPDLVAQGWGPSGFDTPRGTVIIDLRVGGRFDPAMVQTDNGTTFWVRNELLELLPFMHTRVSSRRSTEALSFRYRPCLV